MTRSSINPNVPGLDTRLTAGRVVTTRASTFANTLAGGAVIAELVDPFGAGSTYATVGTVPPQLALNGSSIVRGAGAVTLGAEYSIWIVATSPEGVPQAAVRLVFRAVLPQGGVVGALTWTPGPVAVLLIIGDSNARGEAGDEANAVDPNSPIIGTYANESNAFVRYQPNVRTGCILYAANGTTTLATAGSEKKVGPELGFINAWLAANPTGQLAIVKFARAGSYQTWQSGDDATNSWDATNGYLLGALKTTLTSAIAKLTGDGFTPTLVGIVDVTGTNDASSARAANVNSAKTAMYASFRTHAAFVPSATAFLTVRQYNPSIPADLATVRQAQADVANASADAFLIDIDGASNNSGDGTHRDLAGQLLVGQRVYAARYGRLNARVLALQSKITLFFDPNNPDTIAYGTAPAVLTIADQVGNRKPTQATVASQPTFTANAVNAKAAIVFDGVDDGLNLTATNSLGSGAREIFAIMSSTVPGTDTGSRTVYARGGGAQTSDYRLGRTVVSGTSRFRISAGALNGATPLNYFAVDTAVDASSGYHVVAGRFDPAVSTNGTLFISVDGNAEISLALPYPLNVTDGRLVLGNGISSQYWQGGVRLLAETMALTVSERAALIADLRAEAGV